MSRIGILGGTFDPVHLAHLAMARCAMQQKKLDAVWFMPSKCPPHKEWEGISDEAVRAKLVQLAVQAEDGFEFSDFELQRQGTTYTADTLLLLHRQYPSDFFYFILGGDSLFHLDKWRLPEQILSLATILAVSRDGVSGERMKEKAKELSEHYHGTIEVLSMPQMNISSRDIRKRLAEGKDVSGMLPETVYRYIQNHHYYQST